jgi:hypothetical protein
MLAAITEADYPLLLWAITLAIMALGPALKGWVDVVRWFKGDTLDTTKLATKQELAELEVSSREELKAIEHRLRAQQRIDLDIVAKQITEVSRSVTEILTELRSLHRALGRAEGELEVASRQTKGRTRSIDPT